MSTEARLVLAVTLMIGVIFGTQLLFPPPPVAESPADSAEAAPAAALPFLDDSAAPVATADAAVAPLESVAELVTGEADESVAEEAPVVQAPIEPRDIVVASDNYEYLFSNMGARLVEATLPQFDDLAHEGRPPVQLIPEGSSVFGQRIVVGADTLDLTELGFASDAPDRVDIPADGSPTSVDFTYTNGAGDFQLAVTYTFTADDYIVDVETRVQGVDRPVLLTSLGDGIAYSEADSSQEARLMAYVSNRVDGGIKQRQLNKVGEAEFQNEPMLWTAIKSKYFVVGLLPGAGGEGIEQPSYVGGVLVTPTPEPHRARIEAAQSVDAAGLVEYRMYVGPQEYARLKALGNDLQEVNPYGWAFFRAIVRPFVGVIVSLLNWAHTTLGIGYGWVLILFGFALRLALWPLNAKAMRAQIRNMAVQPLVKELQTKYKDNPEKQQQELMRLYKEHGFNPVAGCLPMLLPWPILIALFFVFQNAIELRGVSFLWLPDLSAKDPFFLLPLMLALSMFLIQYITYKSMPQDNPQMKMMMWFMPVFLGVIFLNFPSGLNLYYASMNVATLPQQIQIANERKKVKPIQPGSSRDREGASGSAKGGKGAKSKKARSRG